jgi:hypothetical protein
VAPAAPEAAAAGARAGRKKLFVSGFYESPGLKFKGLNPDDSANPDTTIKSLACGARGCRACPAAGQARAPGQALLFLHRFNFKVTIVHPICFQTSRLRYFANVAVTPK